MNVTFEKSNNGKEEWLTPPYILDALGTFDLDPCSPVNPPWIIAKKYYTKKDNGLTKQWKGRVWCNPPYGRKTKDWLKKCSEHGNCIVLIFARTETKMFYDYIWAKADAILFLFGRLKFHHKNGKQANTAGAPSALVAFGKRNLSALHKSKLKGMFIQLK